MVKSRVPRDIARAQKAFQLGMLSSVGRLGGVSDWGANSGLAAMRFNVGDTVKCTVAGVATAEYAGDPRRITVGDTGTVKEVDPQARTFPYRVLWWRVGYDAWAAPDELAECDAP